MYVPYAVSEEELRYHLGLMGITTGKGKVNLAESNVRPIEVFMCSIVRKMAMEMASSGFLTTSTRVF
ncbi:hypothetical protein ABFX02_02G092800 [Erythranthe guttata]